MCVLAVAGSVLAVGAPAASAAVPGEPRNVSVSPGASTTLSVSWDAPSPWVSLSSYKVQWKSGSQDYDTARQATVTHRLMNVEGFAPLGFGRTYTIRGLTNGVEYTVRVTAVSLEGEDGPASADVSATPGDTAAPVLRGAVVDGAVLKLVYSEALDEASRPPPGAFAVTVQGSRVAVSEVSVSGREVRLALPAAPGAGDGVTVGYTAPQTGGIQDTAALAAASFGGRPAPHQISGICDRTAVVRDHIVGKIAGVGACADVGVEDLVGVTGTLHLGTKGLTELQAHDFGHLVNLSKLELSFNTGLGSLPGGVFDGLGNLRTLNILDNDVGSLPEGVFDDLAELRRLDLRANRLRELPSGPFDELVDLEYLNLSRNELQNLPDDVFDSSTRLKLLALRMNELGSVPAGVFDNLANLERLFLSETKMTELPPGVFASLSRLTLLDLVDNDLAGLPDGMLQNLSNLGALTLSGNDLTSLPDGLFSGITKLRDLTLEDNPGAPFTFTAELEAQGSAAVVVTVAQGAPFDIDVTLSAGGGTLSSTEVTVAAGSITSEAVTATPAIAGQDVTVTVDSATFGGGYTTTYTSGIRTGLGSPLVVSGSQAPRNRDGHEPGEIEPTSAQQVQEAGGGGAGGGGGSGGGGAGGGGGSGGGGAGGGGGSGGGGAGGGGGSGGGGGEPPEAVPPEAVRGAGFTDVDPAGVHAADIDALFAAGVTEGCSGEPLRFCPAEAVTRAQMATLLARALELPEAPAAGFTDVDPAGVHAADMDALFAAGVTEGCSGEPLRFCPAEAVTRAQMATLLARALELPEAPAAGFTDVDPAGVHAADMDALFAAGVTEGCSGEPLRFCPAEAVTRAQMATLLARALGPGDGYRPK